MKTTISKPEFNPVSITITFESQAELDALGSLFNTSSVAEALRAVGAYNTLEIIVRPLEELGADIHKTAEIQEKIEIWNK